MPSPDTDDFYRRYAPMVFRRCRQLLKDDASAEDVMHDVFVQVLRAPESDVRMPAALLHRVATNLSLNRLRAEKYRDSESKDDELVLSIAHAEDLEERTGAARLLAKLFGREPTSTRTLAVLHLVDGMTLEQVAKEVGLSVSGVRKRLRTLKTKVQALEAM